MTESDQVAFEILRSIRRILRKVSQHSRQISRESGFTVPQLLCMKAIGEIEMEGETTVGEVSRRVRLSPATVSRILDRLEAAGFVVRERGTRDRRKVTLLLTNEGRRRLATLPTPLHDPFLERLSALSAKERLELLTALEKIVEMMEATDLDAGPHLYPDPQAG